MPSAPHLQVELQQEQGWPCVVFGPLRTSAASGMLYKDTANSMRRAGLAGALALLKEKGNVGSHNITWAGRNNDKSKNALQVGTPSQGCLRWLGQCGCTHCA